MELGRHIQCPALKSTLDGLFQFDDEEVAQ
jgi:hypothetical protein